MGIFRTIFGFREEPAQLDAKRLNALETRLDRLELDQGERQLAVLDALNKAVNALAARERSQRRRDAAEETVSPETDGEERAPVGAPRSFPTAHLSRRFKGF